MGGWFNALLQQELANGFTPPSIASDGLFISGLLGQTGTLLEVASFGNLPQFSGFKCLSYIHGAGANASPITVIETASDAYFHLEFLNQANATPGNCSALFKCLNAAQTFQIKMTTDGNTHNVQLNLGDGQQADVFSIGDGASVNQLIMLLAGGLTLKTGATPVGAAGTLGLGTSAGFGTGAAGQAVTTTALGGGTGPTTPTTVVNYLKISLGGAFYWIPLMQ
jgi:hypothetical protein